MKAKKLLKNEPTEGTSTYDLCMKGERNKGAVVILNLHVNYLYENSWTISEKFTDFGGSVFQFTFWNITAKDRRWFRGILGVCAAADRPPVGGKGALGFFKCEFRMFKSADFVNYKFLGHLAVAQCTVYTLKLI